MFHDVPGIGGRGIAQEHFPVDFCQGERRLQLVGGVGDEGTLPLESLPDRSHGPSRHEEAADAGQKQCPESYRYEHRHEASDRLEIRAERLADLHHASYRA